MLHPEYKRYMHIPAVQRAAAEYRKVYPLGGLVVKAAEYRLNDSVESCIAPKVAS